MNKDKKRKIVISIVCISFLQGLQYSVSPILSQILDYYPGISVNMAQMLITAPAILSIFVAVISGWLILKISKKKLLLFAGLLAGITGILPLFWDDFSVLFVSRILYGVALGLATTLNTAVVADFFDGPERITAMGIQGASVGAGMVVVTTVSSWLAVIDFHYAYLVHMIGFLSMILIAICLPDTGKAVQTKTDRISLNKNVYIIAFVAMLECMFLITFTTNIAMHLSGILEGNTTISGNLIGIFSGSQVVIGLVLGYVSKYTGRYTIPIAMLSFSMGALLVALCSSNLVLLALGAIFCGFSQGIFMPTVMVEVSNAVTPVATAMAAACLTCAQSAGQAISPMVLNAMSETIFGEATTKNVFLAATIGMNMAAIMAFAWIIKEKNKKINAEV